jgi:hypothetical protein
MAEQSNPNASEGENQQPTEITFIRLDTTTSKEAVSSSHDEKTEEAPVIDIPMEEPKKKKRIPTVVYVGVIVGLLIGVITFVTPNMLHTTVTDNTKATLELQAEPTTINGLGGFSTVKLYLNPSTYQNISTVHAYITYPADLVDIRSYDDWTQPITTLQPLEPYGMQFRNTIDKTAGIIDFSVSASNTNSAISAAPQILIAEFNIAPLRVGSGTFLIDDNRSTALLTDTDNTSVYGGSIPVTITIVDNNSNTNSANGNNNGTNGNVNGGNSNTNSTNGNTNGGNNNTNSTNNNTNGTNGNVNGGNSNTNSTNGNTNGGNNNTNSTNNNTNGTNGNVNGGNSNTNSTNGNTNGGNNNNNGQNGNVNSNNSNNSNNNSTNRNNNSGGGGGGGGTRYHMGCFNAMCIRVAGLGTNECARDIDCSSQNSNINSANGNNNSSGGGGGGTMNHAPNFINITPAPNSVGNPPNPKITYEIVDPEGDTINRASVKMMVNGRDVTPDITGQGSHLYASYQIKSALAWEDIFIEKAYAQSVSSRVYVRLEAADDKTPPASNRFDYSFVIGNNESQTVLCGTPLSLSATTTGTSVTLHWTEPSDPNITGYTLYIGTSSNNLSRTEHLGKLNTITLGQFTAGQTYYFVLTATGTCTESNYSNMIAVNVGTGVVPGNHNPPSSNPNMPPNFNPTLPGKLPSTGAGIGILSIAFGAYWLRRKKK